jgi:arylsulfatase A-like enzyme
MRVPGIAWWPGRVPAGIVQREMATTMDLFTTCATLAGARLPDRPLDGVDLSPLLFGTGKVEREAFFYYRGTALFAARLGPWKAHFITQSAYGPDKPEHHNPPRLYHLGEDPGEKWDRAAVQPEIIARIADAVARHRASLQAAPSQLEETVTAKND